MASFEAVDSVDEKIVADVGNLSLVDNAAQDDDADFVDPLPVEKLDEEEHSYEDAVFNGDEVQYEKNIEVSLQAKEEGNEYFRKKEYDDAVESYSKAIAYCPEDDQNKENLATFYGNRSAAYATLEEFELVIEDCTAALALKPDYIKIIARRMLAHEKLEKYEEAIAGELNSFIGGAIYMKQSCIIPVLLF
jgi:tetratricopeptide (TPR) repeat protein